MAELNVEFKTPFRDEEKRAMILRSEKRIIAQLKAPASAILTMKHPRVVLVDGPTCSGKSGISMLLKQMLESEGALVRIFDLFSFSRNRAEYLDECKKRGRKIDLSSPDALDLDYFEECIFLILSEQTALMPIYDSGIGERCGVIPFTLRPDQVLIIRGKGMLEHRIKSLVKTPFLTLYVDANSSYESNLGRFSGSDLRFARRFVRDGKRTDLSPEQTYSVLEGEKAKELSKRAEDHVFDFMVDTTSEYEPMILKKDIENVLGRVKKSSRIYSISKKFLLRFSEFPEADRDLLPQDSFYRTYL